jgi:hypothetical protein
MSKLSKLASTVELMLLVEVRKVKAEAEGLMQVSPGLNRPPKLGALFKLVRMYAQLFHA